MHKTLINNIKPLGFTWSTCDPFLFCVHHLDNYPAGNDQLGPAVSLKGRNLGQDFIIKDGWRMYHGKEIPGFPAHPHREFETVTIVLNGFVDHSDSHGASGRYGNGDVQWMTAGAGLQHAEMFPLLNKDSENPLELFQIWLNLPKAQKFSKPHYSMLWKEDIPVVFQEDKNNKTTEITLIAGKLGDISAPAPAPDSWAAKAENKVGIWLIKLDPGALWTVPTASSKVNRSLYFYKGSTIRVDGIKIPPYHSADVPADQQVHIENGNEESLLLLLQGKPINEPVVQHGPFVMNSDAEIQQAFSDYHTTQFGGWPWPKNDNVHSKDIKRFAQYSDGSVENR